MSIINIEGKEGVILMILKRSIRKGLQEVGQVQEDANDDENIIKEMMLGEDELNKKNTMILPDITLIRNKEVKDLGVKITKILLAIFISMFVISLFSPWFQMGGKTTELGFTEIKSSMASKSYMMLRAEELSDYEGIYVVASPMQLLFHSLQYFETYKVIKGVSDEEGSALSMIHILVILTFVLVIIMAIVSIVLLVISPKLKWIRVVKVSSVVCIILSCLNYFVLKIPYINMFVIHAQSALRSLDKLNAVSITSEGVKMNNLFYSYYMTVTNSFFVALGLMGLWMIVSAVLLEIKRKRDEDLREIELKAKGKGV